MLNNIVYSDKEVEPVNNSVQNISEKSLEEEINILQPEFEQIKKPKKSSNLLLLILLLLASFFILISFLLSNYPSQIRKLISNTSSSPTKIKTIYQKATGQEISTIELQQVDNVGYNFYIGQIDYAKSPPLGDEVKNAITQVIYKSQFPKRLLKDVAIIVVNSLAITPDKKIKTPSGLISIPTFPAVFLSGGGLYSQNYGSMSIIYINSKMICSEIDKAFVQALGGKTDKDTCYVSTEFLSKTLTHELAHHIGSKLTNKEWNKFYQLRNIPANTPKRGQKWETSPTEDFAEVYTNTFTGNEVRTYYGLLTKAYDFMKDPCDKIIDTIMKTYESNNPEPKIDYSIKIKGDIMAPYKNWTNAMSEYNTKKSEYKKSLEVNSQVQDCRRDVLNYPEKYPEVTKTSEYDPGIEYKREVSQQTKDFIKNIVNRLNQ